MKDFYVNKYSYFDKTFSKYQCGFLKGIIIKHDLTKINSNFFEKNRFVQLF